MIEFGDRMVDEVGYLDELVEEDLLECYMELQGKSDEYVEGLVKSRMKQLENDWKDYIIVNLS